LLRGLARPQVVGIVNSQFSFERVNASDYRWVEGAKKELDRRLTCPTHTTMPPLLAFT
jgi:hypothetical protein